MQHVPLPGTDRQPLPTARRVDAAPADERLSVTVYVRSDPSVTERPDPTAEALVKPAERPVMDAETFARTYGASQADLEAVERFARDNDLTVESTNQAARSVRLSGTVADISKAFAVQLSRYEYDGGTYRGREGTVNVPANLSGVVEHVAGLDNRRVGRALRRRAVAVLPEAKEAAPHLPPNTYLPPQIGDFYSFPDETDGTGQTIAVLAFNDPVSKGGYSADALQTYFTQVLGQDMPRIVDEVVLGPGNDPGDDGVKGEGRGDSSGEIMLDLAVVGSLAPKATIVVYFTEFTEQGWLDVISDIVSDPHGHNPTVISCSYGNPETPATGTAWTQAAVLQVDKVFAAAAAKGITICCASGDDGSRDQVSDGRAHADFPASSPHVLAVGGTRLETSGSEIVNESVWNDGAGGGATGGGISGIFPLPPWQHSAHVPPSVNPPHRSGRGLPDVSAVADPATGVVIIRLDGAHLALIGGTSASAPQWAALISRIGQALGAPVGFLNPLLYSFDHDVLRDITEGSNGAYKAGPGWDACTGWGSPGGTTLLEALR